MPRNIAPEVLTAIQSGSFMPAIFVMLTFANETDYMWSGQGTVVYMGQTWTGIGSLLGISGIEDGSTLQSRGISIQISGLDPTKLQEFANSYQLGLPAAVYFGLYESPGVLYSTPITMWAGRMDQPTLDVQDASTAKISINCESRMTYLDNAPDRRYTQEDQQRFYPGDLGFMFVCQCQERTLYWGGLPLNGTNV
jgi:hypothetical protein